MWRIDESRDTHKWVLSHRDGIVSECERVMKLVLTSHEMSVKKTCRSLLSHGTWANHVPRVRHCDFSMNDSYNDRMSVDESYDSLMCEVTLMNESSPTGQAWSLLVYGPSQIDLYHTHEWVNASFHTHEWVMSHRVGMVFVDLWALKKWVFTSDSVCLHFWAGSHLLCSCPPSSEVL